jgi:hypothetical protein
MAEKYPGLKYTKDPEALHLYVKDIRILTPKEYDSLRAAIPQNMHKTLFDVLLITGMRYAELHRLYDNHAWYNERRNLIHLPVEAQRKVKRRQLERTIHPLPSMFSYCLQIFGRTKDRQLKPDGITIYKGGLLKRASILMGFQ